MAPLLNQRHEAFCLAYIARQGNATAAYRSVYPDSKESTATNSSYRFLRRSDIADRIEELRNAVAAVVIQQTGIDEARITLEIARVAFATIDKVVKWQPEVVETVDEDEERGVTVVTRTIHNRVTLIGSEKMDEDTLASIAEVSLSANGTLRVKMHPKIEALKVLADRYKPAPSVIEDNSVTNVAYIDAPPRETYEQWEERTRRARDAVRDDRTLASPARPAGRRNPSDVD